MKEVFGYIVGLGAPVMMPIIFTVLGVCIGIKFGKALKSGLLVGVGFVGKSKGSDNKVVHKAIIYLKAQFKEATDEYSTKQENITFSHSTMEGNLYYLENGDWKDEKTFDTLEEAKAYVDTTLGKTAVAA